MDQRKQDLKELEKLQAELKTVENLVSRIAYCTEVIERGICDKKDLRLNYYEESTSTSEDRRTQCFIENVKKVSQIRGKLKISRWVGLVIVFAAMVAFAAMGINKDDVVANIIIPVTALSYAYIAFLIGTFIYGKVVLNSDKLTAKQKDWIEEGKRQDEENRKKNEQARDAAYTKYVMETNDRILECKREKRIQEQELSKHEAVVAAIDVVGKRFKTLEAVEYVIDQLESRLSSSVEVALNKYVAEKKQREKEWMRYENERLQRQLDQKLADQRYAEEVNRQTDHNWEMQRLAKKQLKETEELRKDQEYFQRYGKPRGML